MELRPMTTIQVSIARQEDVKRKQQNELRARESLEQQEKYMGKIKDQEDKHLVYAMPEVNNTRSVSVNSRQSSQFQDEYDDLPYRRKDSEGFENSKNIESTYFQDPNLGRKIDISG